MNKVLLLASVALIMSLVACANPVQSGSVSEVETTPINQVPKVKIVGPEEITADQEAVYTADAYDGDGDTLTYEWVIDGDVSVGQEARYAPPSEGSITVSVVVSDGEDRATDELSLNVLPPPWQPEKLHFYTFPEDAEQSEENIIEEHVATDAEDYDRLVRAFQLTIEIWNRDNPYQQRVWVGGGL